MVERLDQGVGAILEQLDRMGAAEDTLVIFTSDTGAIPAGRNSPLRGFKSSVWEGGIRMPCLARWPGNIAENWVSSQVGLSMDFLPTILAASGARAPARAHFDGVDLLPVLRQ